MIEQEYIDTLNLGILRSVCASLECLHMSKLQKTKGAYDVIYGDLLKLEDKVNKKVTQ